MEQLPLEFDQWYRKTLTDDLIYTELFPLTPDGLSALRTSRGIVKHVTHGHSVDFLHQGSRSQVYRIHFRSIDGSHETSLKSALIIKRFLTPEESVRMNPGIPCPSDDPLQKWESINFLLFQSLHPPQPKFYLNDPQRRIFVTEALDGSYHDLLKAHYKVYIRQPPDEPRRQEIRAKVRHDLETILDTSTVVFANATRATLSRPPNLNSAALSLRLPDPKLDFDPTRIALRSSSREELIKRLDKNIPVLYLVMKAAVHSQASFLDDIGALHAWYTTYFPPQEKVFLMERFALQQQLVHRDFRPENILYRKNADGSLVFAFCDLSDLAIGPADHDTHSLLCDSRVVSILPLDERIEIRNKYFHPQHGKTLQLLRKIPAYKEYLLLEDNFIFDAINIHFRDIGAVGTFVYRTNEKRKKHSRAKFHKSDSPKNLPTNNNLQFLCIEYIALCRMLDIVKGKLPNMREGVFSLCPPSFRQELEDHIQDSDYQERLVRGLSQTISPSH